MIALCLCVVGPVGYENDNEQKGDNSSALFWDISDHWIFVCEPKSRAFW